MTELKLTGGARIGIANATWPFATLKVNKNRLDLNTGIIGNLSFSPRDIISIEPYFMIPIIGQGIKINHRVSKYSKKVIFWTFKNPNDVINQIKQTGFLNNISDSDNSTNNEIIKERQKQGGFPFKTPFAITVVVIWNILFLIDFINFSKNNEKIPFGNGVIMALSFILIISILILVSNQFRKIVLKKGRELKDISRFLYFIIIIAVFMLLNLSVFIKISNVFK